MKINRYLIIFLLAPLFAFTVHKYYISLTKIDFIASSSSIQITMRFFIDDVEKTLNQRYDTKLKLAESDENKNADELLNRYIQSKFKITVDENVVLLDYLGKEYKNDVVLIYIEAIDIASIKNINGGEI